MIKNMNNILEEINKKPNKEKIESGKKLQEHSLTMIRKMLKQDLL